MANGKGKEWLVGLQEWGYTPQFSELDKEAEKRKTKSEYERISGEFQGKDMKQIDDALRGQSDEAFRKYVIANDNYFKASLGSTNTDPIAKAKVEEFERLAEEARKKYDELEGKRDVVRQMEDIQFWEKRGDVESPEQKLFFDKMDLHGATIQQAAGESAELGGFDVKFTLENAKLHAQKGNWEEGGKWLDDAFAKAERVIARKPYLTTKLAHEPKIKAACKIKKVNEATKVKYGDEVDAEWKAIGQLEEKGKFDEAAPKLTALVRRIETEIEPGLQKAREDNAKELVKLKKELDQAKGNPELLRAKAVEIFANTGAAEDLGVDTGENSRKQFVEEVGSDWTAKNCESTFKAYDWFALKKCRKEKSIKLAGAERSFDDDDMWKLVQYRGKVVNEEIDKLRKVYPTLIASATGSEDIESDIDIAFATPKSGDDVEAAKQFNKVIIGRFGKPAGRVFDVNIYPRDYRPLRGDSFKSGYVAGNNKDSVDEWDDPTAKKLSRIDMDVATLLKQRRFLDQKTFDEMLEDLLKQAPDDTTKKRIRKQYEEGEEIYLLTSLEKVDNIRKGVNVDAPLTDKGAEKHRLELAKHLQDLEKVKGQGGKANLAKAQELIPLILNLFEEVYPAETMDVTDALYLDKMGSLRKDQDEIRTLKENGPPDKHHPGKECAVAHENMQHADWVKRRLDGLEVDVKKSMFTNILFANEAIMSQGALNHVVGALQAKTKEKREEELAKLTAADLMQSVNEQVADLFKEMGHYDGVVEEAEDDAPEDGKENAKRRATGEGYVHASKYLFRLLDAAILLNMKYPDEETVQAEYDAVKSPKAKNLGELKARVDGVLLKLRKSAVIPPDIKGEVGALEMQEVFPQVKDIGSYRKMIQAFAVELNNRIRSLEEFKQSQTTTKEEEKPYFETAGAR